MRIERLRIGRRSHYYADGKKINPDTLSAVLKGIFGGEVCAKIFWEVTKSRSVTVERHIGDVNENLIAQLETANKKNRRAGKESGRPYGSKHLLNGLRGRER